MNKFTKADEGKSAIYKDAGGTTYSCTIAHVTPCWVDIKWKTSRVTSKYVTVHAADFANLNLFPAGALFVTV